MYTFYGLVVALTIFDVCVTQCGAVRNKDKNASKKPDDELNLPNEVAGKILQLAGPKATKAAGQSRALIASSQDAMSSLFAERLIVINRCTTYNGSSDQSDADNDDGEDFVKFRNYKELQSLFKKYGGNARRISINYGGMDASTRRDIKNNIIDKYANILTELRIYVDDDLGILETLPKKFPGVTKFTYESNIWECSRNFAFDLHAVFPKLESFKLKGPIDDPNCLKNVENLKELTLDSRTIPEHQFQDIFEKNQQIRKLNIAPRGTEPLQSIDKYLKNLQILKIIEPGFDFLYRGDHIYNLTTVNLLVVQINEYYTGLTGGLSFEMPNLKKLIVRGYIQTELSNLINQFKNLDTVEILPYYLSYSSRKFFVKDIKRVKHVREYISLFDCSQLTSLKPFFETFGKTKSNLNSLKLKCDDNLIEKFLLKKTGNSKKKEKMKEITKSNWNSRKSTMIDNSQDGNPMKVMDEINDHLKKSNKPTWTLNIRKVVEDGQKRYYLRIKRDL